MTWRQNRPKKWHVSSLKAGLMVRPSVLGVNSELSSGVRYQVLLLPDITTACSGIASPDPPDLTSPPDLTAIQMTRHHLQPKSGPTAVLGCNRQGLCSKPQAPRYPSAPSQTAPAAAWSQLCSHRLVHQFLRHRT